MILKIPAAVVSALVAIATAAHAQTAGPAPEQQPYVRSTNAIVPDIFTGSAAFEFPIEVVPARGSAAPRLTLHYGSEGPNGISGVGWSLELGTIEQKLFSSPTDPDGSHYTYVTNRGSVDLAAKAGQIIPKIGSLSLAFNYDNAGASWDVLDGRGGRFSFGRSSASRVEDGGFVFRWHIDRYVDAFGNSRDYEYANSGGLLVPTCVGYGGNTFLGTSHSAFVKFEYETRSDAYTSYRTGWPLTLDRRLKRITSFAGPDCATPSIKYSEYELGYLSGESPATGRSLLTSIQRVAADGSRPLPPIKFEYDTRPADWNDLIGWEGPDAANDLPVNRCAAGNFDGSGFTDVICYGSEGWNTQFTRYGTPLSFTRSFTWSGPKPTMPVGGNCRFADFDADGRTDVACTDPATNTSAVALGLGNGLSEPTLKGGPALNAAGGCLAGDFNGDGRTDFACVPGTGARWEVFFSYAQGWRTVSWSPLPYATVPLDQNCTVGDFDGDAKSEIACTDGGGNWAIARPTDTDWQTSTWSGGPTTTLPISRQCLSGDFNGDGLADLGCYSGTGSAWKLYFSNGKGWVTEDWTHGPQTTFPVTDRCFVGNFDGDVRDDIACRKSPGPDWEVALSRSHDWLVRTQVGPAHASAPVRQRCFVGDFFGSGADGVACSEPSYRWSVVTPRTGRGDLLIAISNPLGGKVSVRYRQAGDHNYREPKYRSLFNRIRFVLSEVEVSDGIGGPSVATTYSFQGGYFHAAEREFRGFAYIRTETNPGSGGEKLIREQWYHQGNGTEPDTDNPRDAGGFSRGKIYRERLSSDENKPLEETEFYYADARPGPTLHYNPLIRAVRKDCSFIPCRSVAEVDYEWDSYGNISKLTERDLTPEGPTSRTVVRTYLNLANPRLTALPTSERLVDTDGRLLTQRFYSYDEPKVCGSIVSPPRGALTGVTLVGDEAVQQRFGYDEAGNLQCSFNAAGVRTDYEWDANYKFLKGISVVAGSSAIRSTFTYYDGTTPAEGLYGQIRTVSDPNSTAGSSLATYKYDPLGRVTQANLADGGSFLWKYMNIGDPTSQHVRIENALGLFDETYFDGMGRTVALRASAPAASQHPGATYIERKVSYDARGAMYKITAARFEGEAFSGDWTLNYDSKGSLSRISDPAGAVTTFCNDLLTSATLSPTGQLRRQYRDGFGRLATIHEFDGVHPDCKATRAAPYAITRIRYDARDQITEISHPNALITRIEYDALGRRRVLLDPYAGRIEFTYDRLGNLVSRKNALGREVKYTYDELNRVTAKTYAQGDSAARQATFHYDDTGSRSMGRLYKVDDSTGTTSYAYDAVGRVAAFTKKTGGASRTIQFDYDRIGRLAQIRYPTGEPVKYIYDGPALFQIAEPHRVIAQYSEFDVQGRPRVTTYGNSLKETVTYGNAGNPACNANILRPCEAVVSSSAGAIFRQTYKFDDTGNLIETAGTSGAVEFGYDSLNRLITSKRGAETTRYRYDAAGNLTFNGEIGAYSYPSDRRTPYVPGDVGPLRLRHDAGGNLLAIESKSTAVSNLAMKFDYDAENKITSIQNNAVKRTFKYDGEGRKASDTRSNTIEYLGNLYRCGSDGCIRSIYSNGRMIAEGAERLRYFHRDNIGSTVLVTNNEGIVRGRYGYSPWGASIQPADDNVTRDRFAGEQLHPPFGAYSVGSRLYIPQLGRFSTPDTAGTFAGNSQELNRFSYASNRPRSFVDVGGMFGEDADEPHGTISMPMPGGDRDRNDSSDRTRRDPTEHIHDFERPERSQSSERAKLALPMRGPEIGRATSRSTAGTSASAPAASFIDRHATSLTILGGGLVSGAISIGALAVMATPVGWVAGAVVAMGLAAGIAGTALGGMMLTDQLVTGKSDQYVREATAGMNTALTIASNPFALGGAVTGSVVTGGRNTGLVYGAALGSYAGLHFSAYSTLSNAMLGERITYDVLGILNDANGLFGQAVSAQDPRETPGDIDVP